MKLAKAPKEKAGMIKGITRGGERGRGGLHAAWIKTVPAR